MAERLDGSVLLAGCDKSIPGMLMAAARLDLASRLPLRRLDRARLGEALRRHREGHHDHRLVRGRRRRAWPARMSEADLKRIECAFAPGEGACGGMYTANTMASVAEALGLSASRARPSPAAADRRRDYYAHRSGEAVVNLLQPGHHRARHPHQGGVRERDRRRAWRSAARRTSCCTCSRSPARPRSSSPSHDFNRIGDKVPHIGRHEAVRQVRHERRRPPRRHPGDHEGAARRGPAARRRAHRHRQDARREPRRPEPRPARRRGAPHARQPDPRDRRHHDPARLARARGRRREVRRLRRRHVFEGPARVFERERAAMDALDAGEINARRRRRHPLRGPEGRPRHARDARDHRRHQGRGARKRCTTLDGRSILRRHNRPVHRPHSTRSGGRRSHRLRARW